MEYATIWSKKIKTSIWSLNNQTKKVKISTCVWFADLKAIRLKNPNSKLETQSWKMTDLQETHSIILVKTKEPKIGYRSIQEQPLWLKNL